MGKASDQPPGLALPKGKVPALRVVPMPADSNHNGDIFGSWIMAQVDVAGGIVADAELVDAGLIFGTGFAPFRGGPLHFLNSKK